MGERHRLQAYKSTDYESGRARSRGRRVAAAGRATQPAGPSAAMSRYENVPLCCGRGRPSVGLRYAAFLQLLQRSRPGWPGLQCRDPGIRGPEALGPGASHFARRRHPLIRAARRSLRRVFRSAARPGSLAGNLSPAPNSRLAAGGHFFVTSAPFVFPKTKPGGSPMMIAPVAFSRPLGVGRFGPLP